VPVCQSIPGAGIDQAVGDLLLEAVTPMAIEVALAVQAEIRTRAEEMDRLRLTKVERAQYEAELAERRYLHVDPANRLVADALEADWNAKLRDLTEARQEYEQQRSQDQLQLKEEQLARVTALVTDFPKLWRDSKTPDRERKRMVRLLIEDVTLNKETDICVRLRFRGGATRIINLPIPLKAWEFRKTDESVMARIDALLDQHTDKEISEILNEAGIKSGCGKSFNVIIVGRLRRDYGLKSRYDRLREAGLLTKQELASRLGVGIKTVEAWTHHGILRAHRYDEKGRLYEDPGPHPPVKSQGLKLRLKDRANAFFSNKTKEV